MTDTTAPRNWTMADLKALMEQEGGSVEVHNYLDGRDVAHIMGHAWIWNRVSASWVVATQQDMKPSARGEAYVLPAPNTQKRPPISERPS